MADIKSKLVLDNAQFNKRAKASKAVIGGLAGGLRLMGGAAKFAAVSLAAGTTAMAVLISRTASAIDRLGKVSKTTGFAADTLQKFQFAAEQSGVGADQAAVALRRFSRRLGEAQKGTGELLPALKKLGIDVRDSAGNLKTGEQILFEFADGLADTEEATERLALAFKAFDSEGAELVEVLRNGSAGLNEFFTEADRLGFVLSTSAIQGVEKFNDEFNKLQRIVSGITRQFVSSLAPALENVTKDLQDFLLTFIEEKGGPEALGDYFKNVFLNIVIEVIKAMETFLNVIIKLANSFADLIRKFGDDPLFGLGDKASAAADDILSLNNVLKTFNDTLGTFETAGEALQFIEGLDQADPLLKKIIDRFKQLRAENERTTLFGTETPYLGFMVQQAIEDVRKELMAEVGAGVGLVDFSEFIEKLIGYTEGDGKPTGEKIGIDIADGMLSVGTQKSSFLVKLLDKIYGPEGQARIDEFLQAFFDDAEGMLDRIKAFTALIFGPDLTAKIKTAFANSDVGDYTRTLAEGMVKAAQMFEDSLAEAFVNGKADFQDLADYIKITLAKAFIQKSITGPLMKLFKLAPLAKGGPAKAGQPYIVGEEGPELFIPKQSGTVIPNDKTMGIMGAGGPSIGGGGGTSVTYNIQAVDAPSFQQLVASDPQFIYAVTQAGARTIPGSR